MPEALQAAQETLMLLVPPTPARQCPDSGSRERLEDRSCGPRQRSPRWVSPYSGRSSQHLACDPSRSRSSSRYRSCSVRRGLPLPYGCC
ncbi:hypothetical protein UY3_13049 [Chelonia mydas]|uniref:Uncharacterized protein n=1 Tax=Chelonia mydas TaxID=8469 RepID=M7B301_CHEMY|nr:hypothetical protein UY3_13049 [Chelonia mydas]